MASATFGDSNRGFQGGIISGSISTTFNLPHDQPETPSRPLTAIPFARDADFIERGTLLDEVHQRCAIPGSWAALVGLGGVGKSQLAIEYAYQTQERSPETLVFWVHASNAARFEHGYRSIANWIKIPERHNPNVDISQLVHDWLQDNGKGKWLLILDNVDDAGFLLETRGGEHAIHTSSIEGQSFQSLISFVPRCQHGSVLITTRSRNAALQLVEQRNIVAVGPMDKRDALVLLQTKLGQQETSKKVKEEIAELAAVLEYIPLAIVQAAAYILHRWPRYSVQQYLQEFQGSDRKRLELLNYEGGQLRRDWEAKNSVIATWQTSFDYVCQSRPSAGNLLALMSFFDRQGISEELLRCRAAQADVSSPQEKKEEDRENGECDDVLKSREGDNIFEEDVKTLQNLHFVSVETGGASFEMYALVQLAMRKWLETNGQLEEWKQQFISNLCAAFPTGEHNWGKCRALFPHVKSAVRQQPQRSSSLEEWATLLYHGAWYAEQIGSVADAEALAVRSMDVRKKVLGQDHDDTLWSMVMVANVYLLKGWYQEAETLTMQVMETRKTKLGNDHPLTLTSMANLAAILRCQGRVMEAKKLDVDVATKKTLDDSGESVSSSHEATLVWDPHVVFGFTERGREDFFCAGFTKKGLPCKWRLEPRQKTMIQYLLGKLSKRSPQESISLLPKLAEVSLCKWHKYQAAYVVETWETSVNHIVLDSTIGAARNKFCRIYSDGIRIVQFIDHESIPPLSWLDKIKEAVENLLEQRICWWPLAHGIRTCPIGYTRICWKWFGGNLHLDLPKRVAEDYKIHCNPLSTLYRSSSYPLEQHSRTAEVVSAMCMTRHSETSSDTHQHPQQATPFRGKAEVQPRPSNQSQGISLQIQPLPSQSIYWCVDKSWIQPCETLLRTVHNVDQIIDDKTFCAKLKEEYQRVRGWKGRLLSWKTCMDIEFIKFNLIFQGRNNIIKTSEGLPDADPTKWAYNRFLPEHVHMKIAAAQIIHTMHNPSDTYSERTTIGMVPKKSDGPLDMDCGAEGWGILAIQGFAIYKIAVWIGFVSFLGLIFAGLWLVYVERTDLQNAFIPYSFFATTLIMILGAPQFLNKS